MQPGRTFKIISVSGIDGAGKSTQISTLNSYLQGAGYRTTLLAFWDDVVVWRPFREFASRRAFDGDQGIGSPDKPLSRRDKNVRSGPLTGIRFLLYLADAVRLRYLLGKRQGADTDVVIFDRYIYDELANLPLNHWLGRGFARLLLKISPRPDAAFLIDADPEAARARKPEYPLDFLHRNRSAYLLLCDLCSQITVIEPQSLEGMAMKLKKEISNKFTVAESDLVGVVALP